MNEQKELRAHTLVDQEWGQVLSLVPVDLEATARAEKAFQRRREVRSADDLLRLVLAYALCDWSLRLTGVWARLIGLGRLSDVAVLKRLRHSQRWLGKLIGAWMVKRRVMFPQRAVRLRLVDATTVSQPGSTGIDWRVHLSLDLGQMCLDGVEVTDVKGGETLVRHPAQPGDILVADRGYAHRRGLGSVLAEGAQAVVRINWQNLPVQELTGEPLDVVTWLLSHVPQGEPSEQEVLLDTPQGSFQVRLIACHLSEQATNAARRHIHKEARKKGRTPDRRTLDAAGFIILVTSLPQEQWSTEQVLELYRIRWQIEIYQPKNSASKTFAGCCRKRKYLRWPLFIRRFSATSCTTGRPVAGDRSTIHDILFRRYPMPRCHVPPRPGRVFRHPCCRRSGSNYLSVMHMLC